MINTYKIQFFKYLTVIIQVFDLAESFLEFLKLRKSKGRNYKLIVFVQYEIQNSTMLVIFIFKLVHVVSLTW